MVKNTISLVGLTIGFLMFDVLISRSVGKAKREPGVR
jgi:hypothetical protein